MIIKLRFISRTGSVGLGVLTWNAVRIFGVWVGCICQLLFVRFCVECARAVAQIWASLHSCSLLRFASSSFCFKNSSSLFRSASIINLARFICNEAKSCILFAIWLKAWFCDLTTLCFLSGATTYFVFVLELQGVSSSPDISSLLTPLESNFWEDSLSEMPLSSSLSFNEKETSALFPVISTSSLVSVKTGFRILHHFGSFSGANPLLSFALSNIFHHSAFKLVYFLLSLLTDASRGENLGKSPYLLQKFLSSFLSLQSFLPRFLSKTF